MTQSQQKCIVLLDGHYSQRSKFLFFPKSTTWKGSGPRWDMGRRLLEEEHLDKYEEECWGKDSPSRGGSGV